MAFLPITGFLHSNLKTERERLEQMRDFCMIVMGLQERPTEGFTGTDATI